MPGLGRDPVRTPIPWSGGPNGGFSAGDPWLPLGDEAATSNVDAQASKPRSMLNLYRLLLKLRRREPALSIGSYGPGATTASVLAYERRHAERRLLIALNLSDERAPFPCDGIALRTLLSTHVSEARRAPPWDGTLAANEGRIFDLS